MANIGLNSLRVLVLKKAILVVIVGGLSILLLIFLMGVLSVIMTSRYLTNPNQESQTTSSDKFLDNTLVSNFGENEYMCTSICYCEGRELDERRVLSSSALSTSKTVLSYLVGAISANLAIQLAREHFTAKCEEELYDSCPYSQITSEELECERQGIYENTEFHALHKVAGDPRKNMKQEMVTLAANPEDDIEAQKSKNCYCRECKKDFLSMDMKYEETKVSSNDFRISKFFSEHVSKSQKIKPTRRCPNCGSDGVICDKDDEFGLYDDIDGELSKVVHPDDKKQCGCFFCFRFFEPKEIDLWIDFGGYVSDDHEQEHKREAICPYCSVDAVRCDGDDFILEDHLDRFQKMHARGFGEYFRFSDDGSVYETERGRKIREKRKRRMASEE